MWQLDLAVGKILDELDRLGLAEDTIVLFTCDHGEFLGEHGVLYKAEFSTHSLLRVPFILRAPGAELPEENHLPMSNCDVFPTLAALCGLPAPETAQGVNIMESQNHDAFVYCLPDGHPGLLNYSAYDKDYRYTMYPNKDFEELYRQSDDPAETINLAVLPEYKEIVASFRAKVAAHLLHVHKPCSGKEAIC